MRAVSSAGSAVALPCLRTDQGRMKSSVTTIFFPRLSRRARNVLMFSTICSYREFPRQFLYSAGSTLSRLTCSQTIPASMRRSDISGVRRMPLVEMVGKKCRSVR